MNRIRNFLYRSPRFKTDCRMDFLCGESVILGVCSNLSESGLRGTFARLMPVGSEGLITIYYNDQHFEVQAKVYSVRDDEARVRFLFETDKERESIGNLLKLLGTQPAR